MMFETQEIHAATFGERLQRARKDRRLKLADTARTLGVRAQYLEALERGVFTNLPPRVYIKGLLKRYTDLLGLPNEEILTQFNAEYEAQMPSETVSLPRTGALLRARRAVITPRRLARVGVVILIASGVAFLGYYFQQYVGAPTLELTSPVEDMFTNEKAVIVEGRTDKNTKVTINGEEIILTPRATFREEIQLQEGLNTLEIVSTTRLGKQTKLIRRIIRHKA